MASNPYDQFDAPQGAAASNPYDQFDEGATPPPARPRVASYDLMQGGVLAPTGSQQAQEPRNPTYGNSFLQNLTLGIGGLYTDADLAARQMYAKATGSDPNSVTGVSGLTALQKQGGYDPQGHLVAGIDQPLNATYGGKAGRVVGALPLALMPGANGYLGASVIGGSLGALQPVTANESRLTNTVIGGALGLGSAFAGDALSTWATQRAAQPFMGWNQGSANAAAARAVGSDAEALDQPAIAEATERFDQIFGGARDPSVAVPMTGQTAQAVTDAAQGLNASSRSALEGNPQVQDLMYAMRRGSSDAGELGDITSKLGNEAASQMTSKSGDRALGRALYQLQDHVDDLIGGSIQDPELKAAYDAARPQYRTFMQLSKRPTLLNSSTGDINLRNYGNFLQRSSAAYRTGADTSELANAARFGQATGLGSKPPPAILNPIKWAAYHAANNPVVGAVGGTVSRSLAPIAPGLEIGLPGAGSLSPVLALPYLEK